MDDWEYEDQTDWYNNGDTSVGNDYTGYTPGYNNDNLDDSYGQGDYNGYTPGYDNPNLDTGNYYQPQPDFNFTGDPNIYGNSGAPIAPNQLPNTPNPMQPSNLGQIGGSIQQALAGLFSGGNAGMIGRGIAALFEGNQNKQKATAAQAMAKSPALDPFGSQRPFYQQQAQQAVTNPYDSPIVKAQIEQLQKAQSIKDAAAGRRSNSLTSSPAVMAEMAKIAQSYQQQMAQQGGSGIAPNGGIAQILQQGSNASINGYASPLANAFGYNSQANNNADTINQLTAALQKFRAQ